MPRYSTTLRNQRMTDITNASGTTAFLNIYTGSGPSLTSAPTGTLLVSMPMSNPIAPAPSGGVLTMSTITPTNGAATGTPGYGRILNSATDDGTHTQVQLTAGIGSGELNFSGQIYSGGQVSCSSFTVTEGNP